MKVFIWIAALVFLVPWTGGAWIAYALVDVSGNWMAGNADMLAGDPQIVETLSWLARTLSGAGEFIIFVVWALGAAIVAAVAWLFCRLVDRDRRIKSLNWHPDDARAAPAGQRIP
jgi:ABC-type multidrug transport system permease subunit